MPARRPLLLPGLAAPAIARAMMVEPRPCAGGNIASAALARVPADSRTLSLKTGGHWRYLRPN